MKPLLLRDATGRPVAGAATDRDGQPTYWSRLTRCRRLRAASMAEARERAEQDAEQLEAR